MASEFSLTCLVIFSKNVSALKPSTTKLKKCF